LNPQWPKLPRKAIFEFLIQTISLLQLPLKVGGAGGGGGRGKGRGRP